MLSTQIRQTSFPTESMATAFFLNLLNRGIQVLNVNRVNAPFGQTETYIVEYIQYVTVKKQGTQS